MANKKDSEVTSSKWSADLSADRDSSKMGQRRLVNLGFSPASRRRVKRRIKDYSNRLRRRQDRQAVEDQNQ